MSLNYNKSVSVLVLLALLISPFASYAMTPCAMAASAAGERSPAHASHMAYDADLQTADRAHPEKAADCCGQVQHCPMSSCVSLTMPSQDALFASNRPASQAINLYTLALDSAAPALPHRPPISS